MKFSHKLTYDLNRLHTKNHNKISLYVKVMHKIPFFLSLKYFKKYPVSNQTLLTKVVDLNF
jgi:hypothetical protein